MTNPILDAAAFQLFTDRVTFLEIEKRSNDELFDNEIAEVLAEFEDTFGMNRDILEDSAAIQLEINALDDKRKMLRARLPKTARTTDHENEMQLRPHLGRRD